MIEAPTRAKSGLMFVITGNGTVNETPLLAAPPTVTTTLPVVAPLGTGTTTLALLQLVGVAAVPLNVTVLLPCVAPKFAPVMVTAVPTAPEAGVKLVMFGTEITVKLAPLLAAPPTVTTTLPVVAAAGTGATMLVLLQLAGEAAVPLNVTVLLPWLDPKLVPVMVTDVPTPPEPGDMLLMPGAALKVAISWLKTSEEFPLHVAVCTAAEVTFSPSEIAASPPEVLFVSCSLV